MTSKMDQRPVALVTGASTGFGRLTAERLAARGYRVFGTNRTGTGSSAALEMLVLDVDLDESVERCVQDLLGRAGRIDVLVNNAGRAMLGACEETSSSEARALFETNVFGVMRMVSAVLPTMKQQGHGSIVNVGSLSGLISVPFHGVYAASKHALAGYSDALRHEVRPFGVRVSLVEPAAHRTGITMARPARTQAAYDADREQVGSLIQTQIETGRDPARVADTIVVAATSGTPKVRYRVGFKALLASWALRLLPLSWVEIAVRYEFGLRPLFSAD